MRVFLSSTFEDLADYREQAARAVERVGQQPIRMETFGARSDGATEVCTEEIEGSDAFIGIYAHRYGFIPPKAKLSITEQEFDLFRTTKKPIFCFLVDENFAWLPRHIESSPGREKLITFKQRLAETLVFDRFTTAEDLAFKVSSALGRHLITARVAETLKKDDVGSSSLEGRTQVSRRAARIANLIRGTRLLLVNDMPTQMDYATQILIELGVTVSTAETTEEALDCLRREAYDLVISDMVRGQISDDGLRLIKRMREAGLYRPTILTVGNYQPDRGTPAYAFGITNRVDELLNFVFDIVERIKDEKTHPGDVRG